jgi:predicted phage terminase large subunit-like protein
MSEALAITEEQLLPIRQGMLDALAISDLWAFVVQAWDIIEPGQPLIPTWHMARICEELEKVTRGETKILVVSVPPGTCKSRLVAVMWPAWEWLQNPTLRSLYVSVSDVAASRDARYTRQIVRSPWYRRLVAQVARRDGTEPWTLAKDLDQVNNFANTSNGQRFCAVFNGDLTGLRGGKLVVDDPYRISELRAATGDRRAQLIAEAVGKWNNELASRVDNPSTSPRVLVMQRVGDGDLAGVLSEMPGVVVVSLPMEWTADHPHPYPSDPRRTPGELLCPGFFPPEVVAMKKEEMDAVDYAAQYQQRPTPAEGGRYKRAWFTRKDRRYALPPHEMAKHMDEVEISIDAAQTATSRSDYCSLLVWGHKRNERGTTDSYLLGRIYRRMEWVELRATTRALCDAWPEARTKIIENKSNGAALISDLKEDPRYQFGVRAFDPGQLNKEARSTYAETAYSDGSVWLPEDDQAPWLAAYIENMVGFGAGGGHDDDVDATSQVFFLRAQGATSWLTPDRRRALNLVDITRQRKVGEHVTRYAVRELPPTASRPSSSHIAMYWGGVVPGWATGRAEDAAIGIIVDRLGRMVSLTEVREGGEAAFVDSFTIEAQHWPMASAHYAELPQSPGKEVATMLGRASLPMTTWRPGKANPDRWLGQVGAGYTGTPAEAGALRASFLAMLSEDLVGIRDEATLHAVEALEGERGDGAKPARGRALAYLLALASRREALQVEVASISTGPTITFEKPAPVDIWSRTAPGRG